MKTLKILGILTIMSYIVISGHNVYAFRNTNADATIVTKITFLYGKDELVNPFNIKVKTRKGHVKLEGLVNSYTEYERALVLTNSVKGVKSVDASNLHVRKSQQLLTDIVTTAKIKGAAIQNKLLTYHDIRLQNVNIETNNGHVFISGVVQNEEQKENLIHIAALVQSVKDVDGTALYVRNKT